MCSASGGGVVIRKLWKHLLRRFRRVFTISTFLEICNYFSKQTRYTWVILPSFWAMWQSSEQSFCPPCILDKYRVICPRGKTKGAREGVMLRPQHSFCALSLPQDLGLELHPPPFPSQGFGIFPEPLDSLPLVVPIPPNFLASICTFMLSTGNTKFKSSFFGPCLCLFHPLLQFFQYFLSIVFALTQARVFYKRFISYKLF